MQLAGKRPKEFAEGGKLNHTIGEYRQWYLCLHSERCLVNPLAGKRPNGPCPEHNSALGVSNQAKMPTQPTAVGLCAVGFTQIRLSDKQAVVTSVRNQTHAGDLRVTEDNTRDRTVVGHSMFPKNVSRGNSGLIRGHMCKGSNAGDVSDCPDSLSSATACVDLDAVLATSHAYRL